VLEAMPGVELDVQEITFLPQATKTLAADELATFQKFLETLDENEDVQEVYHNVVLP
jgi:transcriptional/translational regulatory protein YebC/TACO1